MGKYSVNKFRGVCDRLLDDGMDDTTKAYLDSIDNLELFHSSKITLELLKKLRDIKSKLEAIIHRCDNTNSDMNEMISDKVNTFLDECSDIELVDEVKTLYEEYVKLRNKICENNLDTVIKIACGYIGLDGIDINEVIGWGNIGLITAIEKFDINFGVFFYLYAYRVVLNEIKKNIYKDFFKFCLSSDIANDCYKFFEAIDYQYAILGREPSDNELAQYLGLSVNRIKVLRELIDLNNCCYFADLIPSVDREMDSDMIQKQMRDDVRQLFDYLNEKQEFLVQYRYGFSDGEVHTLEETGKVYGENRQAVFNREKRVMTKLREHSAELRVYLAD